MFTGIIVELGRVKDIDLSGNSGYIRVQADQVLEDIELGESIAVNGVCLTVREYGSRWFDADIMPETFRNTNLHRLKKKDEVNLEKSLRLEDRLGGHLLSGHIDAEVPIVGRRREDFAVIYEIALPADLRRFVAPKGSVAVNGVSLTVASVREGSFEVSIVPHTAEKTNLGNRKVRDRVNLEVDMISRYLLRILESGKNLASEGDKRSINRDFLKRTGFLSP